MPAWALANTVSAYAIVLAGLVSLLLTALMGRHPRHWTAVYAGVVVTGLATVWYHGFGEPFAAGVADIGTNLLLAWLLLLAVLGDAFSSAASWGVGLVLGTLNLGYIGWRIASGPTAPRIYAVSLEDFGGFHVGEALLIGNSLLAVGLLYARHHTIPVAARPLWYAVTGLFFAGMLLATASNQQIDCVIVAYHATWHIVSAFGFVVLWAFNHVRFAT